MNARVFLTLLTSLAVSGCGFQPLYASGTGVSPALSSVEVVTPPTRTGQLLREELDDELARASGDAPRYRLTVDIEERRIARGLRIDDTANRYELRTLLAYQLVDLASGRVVYRNSRPVTVTYDIADAAYAGVSASLDGQERVASEGARIIRTDIARALVPRQPAQIVPRIPVGR